MIYYDDHTIRIRDLELTDPQQIADGEAELEAGVAELEAGWAAYEAGLAEYEAGVAALEENDYYAANARTIMENRAWTVAQLEALGFFVLPSKANFVFATHDAMDGEKLYLELKKRGVLIRHFSDPRIAQYNRVTIGTPEEMAAFLEGVKEIMKEEGLL